MRFPFLKYPVLVVLFVSTAVLGQDAEMSYAIDKQDFNPATLLWYESPAETWEEALPVGNGRLGAMVLAHTVRNAFS